MDKSVCFVCLDKFEDTKELGYLECPNCHLRQHFHWSDYTSGTSTPNKNEVDEEFNGFIICPICKFGEYDLFNTWNTLKQHEFESWIKLIRRRAIKEHNKLIQSISTLVENTIDFTYEEFQRVVMFDEMAKKIFEYIHADKEFWYEWKRVNLEITRIEMDLEYEAGDKWKDVQKLLKRLRDVVTNTSNDTNVDHIMKQLISIYNKLPHITDLLDCLIHEYEHSYKGPIARKTFSVVLKCNRELLKDIFRLTEHGVKFKTIPVDYEDETFEIMIDQYQKFISDSTFKRIQSKFSEELWLNLIECTKTLEDVKNFYFMSDDIQSKFHQNLRPLIDPKTIVMKCSSCEVGIVMRDGDQIKCHVCNSIYCPECGVKLDPSEDHICLKDEIKSFKELQSNTRPCPKCASPIFKMEGCNHMFCVKCKTSFDWKTGEKISGYSNPHRDEWLNNMGASTESIANGFFNLDEDTQSDVLSTIARTIKNKLNETFMVRPRSRGKQLSTGVLDQSSIKFDIFNDERFIVTVQAIHDLHITLLDKQQNFFKGCYFKTLNTSNTTLNEIEQIDFHLRELFTKLLETYEDFMRVLNNDIEPLKRFVYGIISPEVKTISFMRLFTYVEKEKIIDIFLQIHDFMHFVQKFIDLSDVEIIKKSISILLSDLNSIDVEFLNITKPQHDYSDLSLFASIAFSKPTLNKIMEIIWHSFECGDETIDGRTLERLQIKLKGSTIFQRIYEDDEGQYIRKRSSDGKFHQERLSLNSIKGAVVKGSHQGAEYTAKI